MNIPKDIQEDFEKHEGELVIVASVDIGRLIGIEDGDEDYYWIIQKMHDKIEYYSCVMGFIPLKGQLSNKDYERINSVFKLNSSEVKI